MSIVQSINDSIFVDDPPLVVVGDVDYAQLKSFWYKVRCKFDGEIIYLCPTKRNLRANLENHLHGLIHTKCIHDRAMETNSDKGSIALSSGKRGRPTTRSRSTIGNQPDLHSWFHVSSSKDSILGLAAMESQPSMLSDSILSLLCWGFRKKFT